MAKIYALWQVKKAFVDKYTKHRFKSGEVAVFERERAAEIVKALGKNSLLEVDMPEGFHLAADGEVEQTENAAELLTEEVAEESAATKTSARRGEGGKGSKDNKK